MLNTEDLCKKYYVVLGDPADLLFGSDFMFEVISIFGDEAITKPWQEVMPETYSRYFNQTTVKFEKHQLDDFIQRHEALSLNCPFPVKTCHDWIWWFAFSNKWQFVNFRQLTSKNWEDAKTNYCKIITFFDTPAWQRWSIDNHDLKIKNTMESYKFSAKEYIVEKTGFTSYLKKPKVGSLQYTWNNILKHDGWDTNFNKLTLEQCLGFLND
jgi:hypothetical protein